LSLGDIEMLISDPAADIIHRYGMEVPSPEIEKPAATTQAFLFTCP
jgi:hypothetical protein